MTREDETKMWEQARSKYEDWPQQQAFIEGAIWYNHILSKKEVETEDRAKVCCPLCGGQLIWQSDCEWPPETDTMCSSWLCSECKRSIEIYDEPEEE